MTTLALDTSSERSTMAISQNDNVIVSVEHHSQKLQTGFFKLIQDVFDDNNLSISEINHVVVGVGPGSFTGVRIGVSFAKTFCQLTGAELIPIRSYYLGVKDFEDGINYLAVTPSTRSECYATMFRIGKTGVIEHVHEIDDGSPERIIEWLNLLDQDTRVYIFGEGMEMIYELKLPGIIQSFFQDVDISMPDARRAFHFLKKFPDQKVSVDPLLLKPMYVRPSPAELKHRRKNE